MTTLQRTREHVTPSPEMTAAPLSSSSSSLLLLLVSPFAALYDLVNGQGRNIQAKRAGFPSQPGPDVGGLHPALSRSVPGFSCPPRMQGTRFMAGAFGTDSGRPALPPFLSFKKTPANRSGWANGAVVVPGPGFRRPGVS